jgi:hypothetical protein
MAIKSPGRTAQERGALGFRGVVQAASYEIYELLDYGSDFGLVHELFEVEHEEEAGIELADAGDVFALDGADARGGLDGVGADAENFADGIDDEAEGLAVHIDDDAGVFVGGYSFDAEAAAQRLRL